MSKKKTAKRSTSSRALSENRSHTDCEFETLRQTIHELEHKLSENQLVLETKNNEIGKIRQDMADVHEAIETIDAGFAMFDRDDRLVFCNRQYYRTFPVLADAGVIKPGVSFEEIVRAGTERGLVDAATGRYEDYINERMEKHRNPSEPYEYLMGRGRWVRTEERRTPNGAYVGTRTDITNFKLIEQKLAELLDAQKAHLNAFTQYAPLSFYIKDRTGRHEYVNLNFLQLHGLSETEVIGKTMAHFLAEELITKVETQEQQVWQTGNAIAKEFDFPTPDGEMRRLEIRKFPILGKDGKMIALGGIDLDITEIKNANDEMMRARDQAEAANQAKSEFMAAMSHELRTPLTSSLGSLGLLMSLMSHELPEQGQDLLEVALRNNNALLRLVNELLDYEKILSGTFVIETSPHDICALTSNIVKDLQGYAQTQSVNIIFEASKMPVFAKVQEDRFVQILNNLISNAAKFSESSNDVNISVAKNNGTVFVYVKDNGPGIPEEFRESIYEQFTQIDSSSTRRHRGTGLGLTISKALTESMGGTLDFETEMGVGSTFYICFPETDGPATPSY